MGDDLDTGEFLAVHLPHLAPLKGWLKYLNDKLGWLKVNARGNADMRVHLSAGRDDWTEWSYREEKPPQSGPRRNRN
jgi:hypothetical protein